MGSNRESMINKEDETIEHALGRIIEVIQHVKGIKNKDLTEHGISSSQLSQVKAGTKSLSLERLFMLSDGLGVPVSTIINLVEDQRNNRFSKLALMSKICQRIDELEKEKEDCSEKLAQLESK